MARYIDHVDFDTDGFAGKILTSIIETAKSVTNTSSTVLAADADRLYARFENDGNYKVYLALGATAVMSRGIRLDVGDIFEIDEHNRYTGVVTGITTSSGQKLLVESA